MNAGLNVAINQIPRDGPMRVAWPWPEILLSHGRLTAVLSEGNRSRMTNLITCVSLMIAGVISVPIAMLQAASLQSDEKTVTDSKGTNGAAGSW